MFLLTSCGLKGLFVIDMNVYKTAKVQGYENIQTHF